MSISGLKNRLLDTDTLRNLRRMPFLAQHFVADYGNPNSAISQYLRSHKFMGSENLIICQ